MSDMLNDFQEYFKIVPAVSQELKEKAFRLRYEVICHDLAMPGYEPWRFPNGIETDEYDERSAHCLLYHRASGQTAGVARLILPDPNAPEKPFPIELFAGKHFYFQPTAPRRSIAEISRLIISRPFRSRKAEFGTPSGADRSSGLADPQGRRRFPHPILGLLAGVGKASMEQEITHWYAIMEPSLNRLLARFGLDFEPIGPIIEYNGKRQPHFAETTSLFEQAKRRRRDVWELLMHYRSV